MAGMIDREKMNRALGVAAGEVGSGVLSRNLARALAKCTLRLPDLSGLKMPPLRVPKIEVPDEAILRPVDVSLAAAVAPVTVVHIHIHEAGGAEDAGEAR